GEDQFDIPQAQAEHRRQPDRVADALRRDAVSRRDGGVWCDPASFAQLAGGAERDIRIVEGM
ncbi:MAG TPA: hypothetical protein VNR89_04650, partial [Roseomonas sp.]|nr:hypothetical protein [Roseomonas sp.]